MIYLFIFEKMLEIELDFNKNNFTINFLIVEFVELVSYY